MVMCWSWSHDNRGSENHMKPMYETKPTTSPHVCFFNLQLIAINGRSKLDNYVPKPPVWERIKANFSIDITSPYHHQGMSHFSMGNFRESL